MQYTQSLDSSSAEEAFHGSLVWHQQQVKQCIYACINTFIYLIIPCVYLFISMLCLLPLVAERRLTSLFENGETTVCCYLKYINDGILEKPKCVSQVSQPNLKATLKHWWVTCLKLNTLIIRSGVCSFRFELVWVQALHPSYTLVLHK